MRGSWNGGLQVIQVHGQMVTWEVPNFWKHPGTTMELSKKNDDHLLELRVAKMFRQTQMGCLDPLVPTAHHFRASFLGSCHLLNGRPDRMRCFRCFWLHFSVFNGQLTTTMAPWFRYQQRPRFIRNVLLWGDPETAKGDMAPELLELQKQAQARYQASPNGSCFMAVHGMFLDQWYLCVWLVVWNIFFHNRWDNPSHWHIFFRGVQTTNKVYRCIICMYTYLIDSWNPPQSFATLPMCRGIMVERQLPRGTAIVQSLCHCCWLYLSIFHYPIYGYFMLFLWGNDDLNHEKSWNFGVAYLFIDPHET